MKKILFFSIICTLAIMTFTSCENEEIDTIDVPYAIKVFPEPCTAWGCSVDSVKKHMNAYKLSYQDVYENDVTLPDGTVTQKWLANFAGTNPYSLTNSVIEYNYCFDESSKGLRATVIYLGGENQFSDIETQLHDGGYSQTGRDIKDKYYTYSNGKTSIKIYELSTNHYYLKYQKLGDDELTW